MYSKKTLSAEQCMRKRGKVGRNGQGLEAGGGQGVSLHSTGNGKPLEGFTQITSSDAGLRTH